MLLVVAKIVGPDVIGLMAMAMMYFLLLHQVLVDSLPEAIVQRADLAPEHLEAVFWFLAAVGILAALASFLLAPLIAGLFGEPELVKVVRWLGLAMLLLGPASTLQCQLRRSFAFRALALRSTLVHGTSCALAIGLALGGWEIWSLVVAQIVLRLLDLLILLRLSPCRPKVRISLPHLAAVLPFGINNMSARLVGFLALQVEQFLIGIFFGAVALGWYSMARRLIEALLWSLPGVVNLVAFSALSRVQDRPDKLREAFDWAALSARMLSLPAFVGLAVVTPELVQVVLGREWMPMVPVVQVLCLYGICQAETYVIWTGLRAVGRLDLVLLSALLIMIPLLISIIVAIPLGLVAISWVVAAVSAIALPLQVRLLGRFIAVDYRWHFRHSLPILAAVAAMVASIVVMAACAHSLRLPPAATVIAEIVTGASVYIATSILLAPQTARVWLSLLRNG